MFLSKKLDGLVTTLTSHKSLTTNQYIIVLACDDGIIIKTAAEREPSIIKVSDIRDEQWQTPMRKVLDAYAGSIYNEETLARRFGELISSSFLDINDLSKLLDFRKVESVTLPQEITQNKVYLVHRFGETSHALGIIIGLPSLRTIPEQRKAHAESKKVSDYLRTAKNIDIALVLAHTKGRAILLAPSRPKDYKVILDSESVEHTRWTKRTIRRISHNHALIVPEHSELDIDAYFSNAELDEQFNSLCQDYKLCLIQELLTQKNLELTSTILRAMPDAVDVGVKSIAAKLATNHRLQSHFLAVIDGLVLRTLLHRFIEVYHGRPITPTHDEVLMRHTTEGSYQASEVGKNFEGKKYRFPDARRLKASAGPALRSDYLDLEKAYGARYGGDLHEGSVHFGIDLIERTIGADYLVELLDLTHSERYSFRYEDLRPEVLETFYETSLEMGIDFKLREHHLEVSPNRSNRRRKELGAYFTPSRIARYTVKHSLGKLLDYLSNEIKQSLKLGAYEKAEIITRRFSNLKICDPTMGGGSFLKEAFRLYASPTHHEMIIESVARLPASLRDRFLKEHPWAQSNTKIGDFEKHVLTNNIYGVDFDIKSLYIGSQTLTLESLHYVSGEEKLPSFINVNLKTGNSFISLIETIEDIQSLPKAKIAELIALRKRIHEIKNETKQALLFEEEKLLIEAIQRVLRSKRTAQWGFDPSELKAFTWELQFPEVFFDDHGNYIEGSGFDCIIGNPPWENIGTNDVEFFESLGHELPSGRATLERDRKIDSLLKDRETANLYQQYIERQERWNQFLSHQEQYKCLAPQYSDGGSPGKPNTYKLATEKYWKLLSANGTYGFLIPEGVAGDESSRDLRLLYMEPRSLRLALAFNEDNEVFPDATQAFLLWIGQKYEPTTGFVYKRGFVKAPEVETANISSEVSLSWDAISSLDIETKPLIEATGPIDALLFRKYGNLQSPKNHKGDWGFETSAEELNTTRHASLVTSSSNASAYIFKGDHMDRFQSPRNTGLGLNIKKFKEVRSTKIYALTEDRVCWRNIAGQNLKRRMYAAVVPGGFVGFNSVNIIRTTGDARGDHLYFIVGVINSFVYEYLIRKTSKNNNLNIFYLKLLPFPFIRHSNSLFYDLVRSSRELHKLSLSGPIREELEAACEATVAHIYGLTVEEFEFVLESFDKIDLTYRKTILEAFKDGQVSKLPQKRAA